MWSYGLEFLNIACLLYKTCIYKTTHVPIHWVVPPENYPFSTNFGLYAPSDYFGTCSDKVRYTKITSLEQMNTCHISHAYFKVDLVNHTLIWTYHSSVINCYQLHRQAYLHYDIIVRNSHFWTPCIFSSSFPMQQIHWYYD